MCIVLLMATYVAAKTHFFTRYFELPLGAYWSEHWPFTAGLAMLSGVVALLAGYIEKNTNGGRE
jgi:hypothetical protein